MTHDMSSIRQHGEQSMYCRFLRNMAKLLSGTGGAAILSMGSTAINVRALSLSDLGILILLQTVALIVAGIVAFSTQQPMIALGVKAQQENDRETLCRLFGTALQFDIVASTVGIFIGFAVILLGYELIDLPREYMPYGMTFAVAIFFMGYPSANGIFRLYDRFGLLSLIQVGMAALQLSVSALFWTLNRPLTDYIFAFAFIMAATYQVQLFFALRIAKQKGIFPKFHKLRWRDPEFRKFFDYAWTTSGTGIVDTIRSNGDSLVVSAIAGVQALALYNVAKQLAGVIRKFTTIYALALFPEIADLHARDALEAARRLRSKMIMLGGLAGLSAITGAAFLGIPVLTIAFGEKFAASHIVLILLTAAGGLQLVSHTLTMYTQIYISPVALFRFYVISLVAFCIAIFIATPIYGMEGAAFAQIVFIATMTIIAGLATSKALKPSED